MNVPAAAVFAAILTITTVASATAQQGAPSANSKPATGAAELPDSTILARVDDRAIRVAEFREFYSLADRFGRPAGDSTGRVEFLGSLVDKHVLGLTARRANTPLEFEDRLNLRAFTNDLLATTIYQRRVVDSVKVTNADLKAIYPQFSYEMRFRFLVLYDPAAAERLRLDLIRGRIAWSTAARMTGNDDSLAVKGTGWVTRQEMSGPSAPVIFDLRPLEISPVVRDQDGYRIWQCLDRRTVKPPAFRSVRLLVNRELRSIREAPLRDRMFAEVGARAEARYDTANIVWLADRFREANPARRESATAIDLNSYVPRLAPADTGRVLAWAHGAPFTARQMLSQYEQVPSVLRRKVNTPGELFDIVQRMLLQPDFAALARERGLDQDPEVVRQVELRRERLMVQRMYDDSVLTRVRVDEAMQRKFYEGHREWLVEPGIARYAMILRATEAGCDSVLALLNAGVAAEQIVMADSLAGQATAATQEQREDEKNTAFYGILFGELKPGQSTKVKLADAYAVLHLFDRKSGRPQTYEEARSTVEEAVQAAEAERILHAWLARLRPQFRIESHPELVMGFSLIAPPPEVVLPRE